MIPNKLFDALKLAALVIFPILIFIGFEIIDIWGLGVTANQVIQTIVAVEGALGIALELLSKHYNKKIQNEKENKNDTV